MRLYDQNHLRNLNPPRDLVGSFFMKGATCVYPVGGLFLSLVAIEQKRNHWICTLFRSSRPTEAGCSQLGREMVAQRTWRIGG